MSQTGVCYKAKSKNPSSSGSALRIFRGKVSYKSPIEGYQPNSSRKLVKEITAQVVPAACVTTECDPILSVSCLLPNPLVHSTLPSSPVADPKHLTQHIRRNVEVSKYPKTRVSILVHGQNSMVSAKTFRLTSSNVQIKQDQPCLSR